MDFALAPNSSGSMSDRVDIIMIYYQLFHFIPREPAVNDL
jgi:hypothetical protein